MLVFLLFVVLSPIIAFLLITIPFQIFKMFFKPKLHRKWHNLFKELPYGTIDPNDNVYIRNIRYARYNPNYEYECNVNYLNKKYNVNDLEKAWLFVNPYGLFQSHIILSLQFSSDNIVRNFLTVSYEIRKSNPMDFQVSSLIFKNFEGHFILAPEEDTVFVRTNVRHNYEETHMYMFPLNIPKDVLQKIFLEIIAEVNDYHDNAHFYRVYNRSCVTEIFKYFKKYGLVDYKTNFVLSNVIKFLYSSKLIDGSSNISYAQFKKKYYITGKTEGLQPNENFSFELRKRVVV